MVVVQSLSHVWLYAAPWTAAYQASLFFTISQHLLKLIFFESLMLSNHLTLSHHLLLLPSIFPNISVFSNESNLCIRRPKLCSFSTSPSGEYSGLISFRIDWFDLLAVLGTLKSLLQHHNLKASILWHSTSVWSNYHIPTWPPETGLWPLLAKWYLYFLIFCLGLS